MVSNTGDGIESTTVSRGAHAGQAALGFAVVGLLCTVFPATREVAWVPALPAVVLALVALDIHPGRKRYAAAALLIGWFVFAYSFAMMLWG